MMERLAIPVRASKCTQMKQEFADLQLRTHRFQSRQPGNLLTVLAFGKPKFVNFLQIQPEFS